MLRASRAAILDAGPRLSHNPAHDLTATTYKCLAEPRKRRAPMRSERHWLIGVGVLWAIIAGLVAITPKHWGPPDYTPSQCSGSADHDC
jgi:hypothetical protein